MRLLPSRIVRSTVPVALACAIVFASAIIGSGASAGSVVGANVLSATSLSVANCAPNTPATSFGLVLVSTSNVTSTPCEVTFGSSNDTSTLRVAQRDGFDTAMISTGVTKTTSRSTSVAAISDVEHVAGALGWGAGTGGLAVTSDSGLSWTYPAFGVTTSLDAVAGWSTAGGVAVGTGGAARYTTNGTTWTSSVTGTPNDLYDVDAAGAGSVWAVGELGTILHSIDGGATWSDQTNPAVTTASLHSVSVVDADVAWISGNGNLVLRTQDAGVTWDVVHAVASTSPLTSIVATSAIDAFAIGTTTCGSCEVRRVTDDGGVTWSTYTGGESYSKLSTDGAGRWFVAGTSGDLGYSTDGLQTIVPSTDSTTPVSLNDVEHFTGLDAVAVGKHGLELTSDDAGVNWNDVNPDADRYLHEVGHAAGTIWAVGESGSAIRSTDLGVTWQPKLNAASEDLFGTWVRDPNLMLAVGDVGRIVRTADGGSTFTTPASGVVTALRSVAGHGSAAWAVGDGGVIVKSVDAGATWSAQASGTTLQLIDVSASSPSDAWAVGASGVVIRTSDGGATWTPVVGHGLTGSIAHVVATSPDWQWLASGNTVARTVDGGATWQTSTPNVSYQAGGFDAASSHEAVFASSNNRMFTTYDGGANWVLNMGGGTLNHTGAVLVSSGTAFTSTSVATINKIAPPRVIDDHAPGSGRGWTDNATSFGVCLDSIADGATVDGATWTPVAGCAPVDGVAWRAVPVTTGNPSSLVTRAPNGDTDARAALRFGLKVSSNQAPGDYVAPIRFEVIAPG